MADSEKAMPEFSSLNEDPNYASISNKEKDEASPGKVSLFYISWLFNWLNMFFIM